MILDISLSQARKLVLRQQGLLTPISSGAGKSATLKAIDSLGYVQIDTISVIERAHNHTLWNRVKNYRPQHLDVLQKEGKIFEHWAHALAYLPMSDYRFCKPLMKKIASGERHWYPRQPREMNKVLARIKEEGALRSDDFDNKKKKSTKSADPWGNAKPARIALLQLFMEGRLMVSRRDKFQKVYDLTERVLPPEVDLSLPCSNEYTRWLIIRYLQSNGIGKAEEIAYLRKGALPVVRKAIQALLEEGVVERVKLQGDEKPNYFALPETLEVLNKRSSLSRLKILSPFDNLVIQRKRLKNLFDFNYQVECYVPKAKRIHGYFCLPLLWSNNLVGLIDIKADKQNNTLIVQKLITNDLVKDLGDFSQVLGKELKNFSIFNRCEKLEVNKVSTRKLKPLLLEQWKSLP